MEAVTIGVLSVTAALALGVALAVTLAWRASTRRTSAEIAELRSQIEALAAEKWSQAVERSPADDSLTPFLITDLGRERAVAADDVRQSVVLSATVGEPLVRIAALAHGLRRALTPENRNRIRFEMKRELRRSRKARRAAQREAARNAPGQVAS